VLTREFSKLYFCGQCDWQGFAAERSCDRHSLRGRQLRSRMRP